MERLPPHRLVFLLKMWLRIMWQLQKQTMYQTVILPVHLQFWHPSMREIRTIKSIPKENWFPTDRLFRLQRQSGRAVQPLQRQPSVLIRQVDTVMRMSRRARQLHLLRTVPKADTWMPMEQPQLNLIILQTGPLICMYG